MEVLRRRRRVDDPLVVLRTQGEEALHARAGVLGALAFEPVGEEQPDAAGLAPLVLGGGDELVDDDLRGVDEVAELRFPQDECFRVLHRVAVLEAERGVLGEHRVVQHERGLIRRQMRERDVFLLGALVDQDAVPLAERAPAGVLSRETDGRPLEEQRAEGERLRERPVDLALVERHAMGLENALELRVHRETLGARHQPVDDPLERPALDVGRDAHRRIGLRRREPRLARRVGSRGQARVGGRALVRLAERSVEAGPEVLADTTCLVGGHVALAHERLGVARARRRMCLDELVHARLRERGLVGLVVAVPPVADHVDDDVLAEGLPELEREPHHPDARFGVVAVDVEDGRLDHLGDVGRVDGGPGRVGRGGEAELVVDDEVDGAADAIAAQGGQVQRLGHDALPRKGGVAVEQHWQHLPALPVALLVLLGAGHALDDGIDGFEMTRVRRQRDHDLVAPRRRVLAGRADVVPEVT